MRMGLPARWRRAGTRAPETGSGAGGPAGTPPARQHLWWPVALLAGLVLLYEPRLTLNQGLPIPDDFFTSDLMNDRYPARVELGRALRAGRLPLWTRLIYCGFPLQANPETGLVYPPNLLLFGLLPPALALNYSILLKFFLAGLFVYLLAGRLGAAPGAALASGIAFAWCGFAVAHLRHLNMHDAAIWLPLLLYLLERYRGDRQWRWLLWTAAVFGLQILAGHPQVSYYTGLVLGAYLLWIELPRVRRPRALLGASARVAGCLGLGVALGMVQLWPTLELVQWSERAGGVSAEFANRYPYHLPDLLTFVRPYANGDPGAGTYRARGIFWEDYGYVGLLPLLGAAWALWRGLRRRPEVRFYAGLGLAGAWLMLGDQAGLHWLARRLLPGMGYFRFASRFVLLVDLAVCVLAGLGLDSLLRGSRGRAGRSRGVTALCLLLLVADLFWVQRRQNPVVARAEWERLPATAELVLRDAEPARTHPLSGVQTHLAAYHQARGWQADLAPYVRQRAALQPSGNMLAGIATSTGYMNLVPRHLIDLWGNEKSPGLIERGMRLDAAGMPLIDAAAVRTWSAYGVRHVVSIWPLRHPALSLAGTWAEYAVYRNAAARPRCRFLPLARAVAPAEEGQLLERFARGGVDPDSVFVHAEAPLPRSAGPGAGAGAARLVVDQDHRLEIDCEVGEPGAWLFVADSYYPGWQARLDGVRTPIYRANVAGRAVWVPAGTRRVSFAYRPRSFYGGLCASALALGAIGAGLAGCARRRRAVAGSHACPASPAGSAAGAGVP